VSDVVISLLHPYVPCCADVPCFADHWSLDSGLSGACVGCVCGGVLREQYSVFFIDKRSFKKLFSKTRVSSLCYYISRR
jgi:hypothetical protein